MPSKYFFKRKYLDYRDKNVFFDEEATTYSSS